MQRRKFLKAGVAGAAAAATLATPAIAQDKREWKMVTAWPKNLPGPGVAAQLLADRITTLSGGRIEVKLYAAGEIVPGPGVFDAVSEGTAELYHAVPAYWGSKSKGILLFGSQPFGLRADEQFGWMQHGGGQALYDEMYGPFWRKAVPVRQLGSAVGRLVPQRDQLRRRSQGPEIPHHRPRIGNGDQAWHGRRSHGRTAHVPGAADRRARCRRVHRPLGPTPRSVSTRSPRTITGRASASRPSAEECGVNAKAYEELPADLQQVVSLACESLYNPVWTEYTTKHAQSLKTLVSEHGVNVRKLPDDVIVAMGKAAEEVVDELRQNDDELVKRITESYISYRDLVGGYMTYADNGQMNARASVMGY
jgi:TRAP-type mannitol/chloroaromatic compound transport system substrate-binding protein